MSKSGVQICDHFVRGIQVSRVRQHEMESVKGASLWLQEEVGWLRL